MRSEPDAGDGPKYVFLESLARCERGQFFAKFYERFLASSPEVADKFRFTDFDRQRRMLMRSLELIATAVTADPRGIQELHARAETHSHARLNIEPRFYDLWLDAALETAQETDPEWTAETEAAWRTILGLAIRHMTRLYEA